ncbi:hypothetical protein ACFL40_02140 [candidate division KSB1 bacterium]
MAENNGNQNNTPQQESDEITDPLFLKLKNDQQRANYCYKTGNQEKAKYYANLACDKAIHNTHFNEAIQIAEEYNLPQEKIIEAADGLFNSYLAKKKYEEALKVCEDHKLNPQNLPQIALIVFKKYITEENFDEAKSVKAKFNLKKDSFSDIVSEVFIKTMQQGKQTTGETLIKDFEISNEEAAPGYTKLFHWYIEKKKYQEAIQLNQKFTIPKTLETQKDIIIAFSNAMVQGDFELAKAYIKAFDIQEDETLKIILWLIDQKFKTNSIDDIITIKNNFNPPAESMQTRAYASFEQNLMKGNLDIVLQVSNNFTLPEEKVIPLVSQLYKIKMQSGNYDKADELKNNFSIPQDILEDSANLAFEFNINRGNYKRASSLKADYQIPDEKTEELIINTFEGKLNQNNIDAAKMILSFFHLNQEKINILISNMVAELSKKNLFEKAAYLGNQFNLPKSDLEKIEWKVFDRKMAQGKYFEAHEMSKKYNLSPEKIQAKIDYYIEQLEQKGAKESADLIKQHFKAEKKGFFKKLLG